VAVFEIGRVYRDDPGWPREERRVGILLAGSARAPHWAEGPRAQDVFDLKGILEAFPLRLDVRPFSIGAGKAPAFLHPGRSGVLSRGKTHLGFMGALLPELAARFDAKGEVLLAEVSVEALFGEAPGAVLFEPLGRFPVVRRDISAIVPAHVAAERVLGTARQGAGDLAQDARIVGRFEDASALGPGRVSLTVGLTLQAKDRTLTNEEVAASLTGAVRALKDLGAEIRGE
jgi:phenylalanyl-tRNA synthetase beta chain